MENCAMLSFQEKVLGLPLMSKSVYAIHVAAELGDAAMVEMLIKEGADVSSKTSSGKTAAELAKKKGKSQLAELFLMCFLLEIGRKQRRQFYDIWMN